MQVTESDQGDARYGWVMVFVAFTLTGMSFGGLGAVGVFLKPIAADLEWSRGGTALGYTAAAMGTALFGIVWGMLADRNPTRRFTMLGGLAIGIAMLLLSRTTAQWQFFLFYFGFGAFGHAAFVSPLWANVGQWFTQNKGTALGVALAGGAVGQAVVPFSARLLISAYGWQTAYPVLGAIYLVLGVAIASMTRDPPAKRARLASLRRAEATSGSWSLGGGRHTVIWTSLAAVFCCSCMAVAIVHVVPMLSDRGFSPEVAAGALTAMMLVGALGRMGAGRISDLIGPLRTYVAMSMGQTFLIVWLPYVETMIAVYLLAALFGFFYSGVMVGMVITVNSFVPAEVAARCWSVVALFSWVGMGLGAYVGGALFDVTGGYDWSFAFAGAVGVVNLAILISFHISRGSRGAALASA